MLQIAFFLVVTLLGVLAGHLSQVNPIETQFFPHFASFALVVGLYGSVIGIDLEAIRRRKWLAVAIITIAVPVQILATGVLMYLIYPVAVSWLLAVAIDQIDPISTATLLQDKEKMSEDAKGILRVWASFDDPVTVIFGFFILLPLVTGQSPEIVSGASSYLLSLALNLVPALLIWLIYRYTRLLQKRGFALGLLMAMLLYAFLTGSYLLAAIAGLLLRPIPERYFQSAIKILYYGIVFVVGMAIHSYGVDLRLGILLAVAEFFVVQPISALVMFNGTASDVFRVAYAQQNGLTTLLMGIAFESLGIHVLHILLPAIVIVNLFNLAINKLFTWKEKRGFITG